MPRTIKADGRTIVVPDDATPGEINEKTPTGGRESIAARGVRVLGPDRKTYLFPAGTNKDAAVRYFKSKGITGPADSQGASQGLSAPRQYQYVKLPDGSYGKFDANAKDSEIRGHIERDFPDAFKNSAKPGAVSRFASSAADSSGLSMVGHALAHPIDSAISVARSIADPFDTEGAFAKTVAPMVSETINNAKQGVADYGDAIRTARNTWDAKRVAAQLQKSRRDFGRAIPVLGPTLAKAQDQEEHGDLAGMTGTLAGTVATAAAPEALKKVAPAAADSVSNMAGSARDRFYPQPKSLPTNELAARNLAKALAVSPQGMDGFVSAATDEAGTVLDHAGRAGIPINGVADFAKAAKSASREVRDFYDQKVLGPNRSRTASLNGIDYRGKGLEGGKATLGDIDTRINAINQELNPNYRKALPSQTAAANVSDADLLAEKRALAEVLHKSLGDINGIAPEDVAGLRQRAGKLRTIAEEAQLSANTDTAAAGKAARGLSQAPTSKVGLAQQAWIKARGGPEVIGNKALKSALMDIEPKGQSFPELSPQRADGPEAEVQRQGAQQAASHAANLDQSAQDAAGARKALANEIREGNRATSYQQRTGRSSPVDQDRMDQVLSQPPPTTNQSSPPIQLPSSTDPSPETHHFSRSEFLRNVPDGNVDSAARDAENAGFEVHP
jgi:hypothetical protein